MDLDVLEILIRVVIGGAIGFCIGLTGVGGGVLVVPALALLGVGSAQAVATASVIFSSCHDRRRNAKFVTKSII